MADRQSGPLLLRFGTEEQRQRFLPRILAGIGMACLLLLIFPFVKAPVGFAAVLVVAALIARRALAPQSASLVAPVT